MITIDKALVIREPWIDLLLSGHKTWEMRGQRPSYRGWMGLIRKGSGRISGIARLVDVGHPLTEDQMVATFDKHRIPEEMIRSGEVAKWTTPWKLADIRVLRQPVPYRHPNGAIGMFSLDPAVNAAILAQLGNLQPTPDTPADREPALRNIPAPASKPSPAIAPPASAPTPGPGTLMGDCDVTQGNLTHNHFYMRGFIHRFPGDLIGGSNADNAAPRTAILDWGGTTTVETDIDGDKKFFRKRGWIRQFYADNDAVLGDRVRVTQTAPYRYKVTLVKGAA